MSSSVPTPPAGYVPDPQDVADNKAMAILGNFSILFLVPLFACPHSPFARFYANRGLLIFILNILSSFITWVPFVGRIMAGILGVAALVIFILGVVDAANGRTARLPFLGDIRILK